MAERRRGPLVDGTAYQRDELIREIEAYHRAALSAHRHHTSLSLALPALPDLGGVPDAAWRAPEHDVRGGGPRGAPA
jgi:hypothetical protein